MAKPKIRLPVLNPSHPLAYGLVGAWLMHEGVGSTVHDAASPRSNGTLSGFGTTWANPYRRLSFSGSGWVNCGDNGLLDNTGAVSIVVRTNANSIGFLLCKGNVTSYDYSLFYDTGGAGALFYGANAKTISSGGAFFVAGSWYTYVVTASTSAVNWYRDGKFHVSGVGITLVPRPGTSLTIGGRPTNAAGTATDFRTNDSVEFAMVYNRALSRDEVSAINADPYQAFRTAPLWVPTFTAGGGSPPTAPSDLTATATGTTTIDLAWTDNSGDETGFKIERGTDGVVFAQIDTAAADATTYNDTGLTANTLYYYRVRAYNGSGDSSYSNTASATTDSDFIPRHGAVMLSSGVAIV